MAIVLVLAVSARTFAADVARENTLGMKFVPVSGTSSLFSVWETRVQDFEAFVKASGYDASKDVYSDRGDGDGWRKHGDSWQSPGFKQSPQHPATGVSYDDAKAFCAWLTKKERAEGKLTAKQEYRLPTDEEWSLAVGLSGETAGTPKERSTRNLEAFPWGKEFPPPKGSTNIADETARHGRHSDYTIVTGYEDGFEDTAPVGSFAPTRNGLYDLSGNVWEWCEDFFDGKAGSRVVRGGAYSRLGPHYLESAFRLEVPPTRRRTDFGFRCVLADAGQ
jgi:formylglycine-generating enzyme required for sulfatase activity